MKGVAQKWTWDMGTWHRVWWQVTTHIAFSRRSNYEHGKDPLKCIFSNVFVCSLHFRWTKKNIQILYGDIYIRNTIWKKGKSIWYQWEVAENNYVHF